MLSILIPVYNFDIRNLVLELHKQAVLEHFNFEIVVFDDVSDMHFKTLNREIIELKNVQYTELTQNIGRSKIRNLLSSTAKFNYLLFMDADAIVPDASFIKNYVNECKGEVVICGGTSYATSYKEKNKKNDYILRLKYGQMRESKTANERRLAPNSCFSTFNFLISKSILQRIVFNETITDYGHEDTLFGLELKIQNITIKHIDNPLYHIGLDTNSVFITKALAGVKNLFTILNRGFYTDDLQQDIKLLRYYKKINNLGLTPFFGIIYQMTHRRIKRNLVARGQNLFYFDMLRLGFLCTLK